MNIIKVFVIIVILKKYFNEQLHMLSYSVTPAVNVLES